MALHKKNSALILVVIIGILASSSSAWAAPSPSPSPRPEDRRRSEAEIQAAADRARAEANERNRLRLEQVRQQREQVSQQVIQFVQNFETEARRVGGGNADGIRYYYTQKTNFSETGPTGLPIPAPAEDPGRAETHVKKFTRRQGVANDAMAISDAYESIGSDATVTSAIPILKRYQTSTQPLGTRGTADDQKWAQYVFVMDKMGTERKLTDRGSTPPFMALNGNERPVTDSSKKEYYDLPGHRPGTEPPAPPPGSPPLADTRGADAAKKVKKEAGEASGDLGKALTGLRGIRQAQENLDKDPQLEDPERAARNAANQARANQPKGNEGGGGDQAKNDGNKGGDKGGGGGGAGGGGGGKGFDGKAPDIQNLNLADGLGPFLSSLGQGQDTQIDRGLFGPLEPQPIPSRDIANDFKVKDFPGFPNPFGQQQPQKYNQQNTAATESGFKGVSTSGRGSSPGGIGGGNPAPPEGAGGGPGGGGSPGLGGGKGGGGEGGGGGDPFGGVGREEGEGPRQPNKFETLVELREGGTGEGNGNEGGNAPGAELAGPETLGLGGGGGGGQALVTKAGRGATVMPKHILRYMRLPAQLCRENKMGICERLPKLLASKQGADFPSRDELIATRVKIPSNKGR